MRYASFTIEYSWRIKLGMTEKYMYVKRWILVANGKWQMEIWTPMAYGLLINLNMRPMDRSSDR